MILAVKSWILRQAARTAIGAGEFEQAFKLAAQAQELQRTAAGEALGAISGLLCDRPPGLSRPASPVID